MYRKVISKLLGYCEIQEPEQGSIEPEQGSIEPEQPLYTRLDLRDRRRRCFLRDELGIITILPVSGFLRTC